VLFFTVNFSQINFAGSKKYVVEIISKKQKNKK